MSINYGQLLAAIAGMGGIAAIGSHMRANRQNSYDDQLNKSLQAQGAQPLDFGGHRRFAFGDTKEREALHNELYKQAVKAHDTEVQGQQYQPSLQKFGIQGVTDPTVAKTVLAPYLSQDAQMQVPGQYGPRALAGATYLDSTLSPQEQSGPTPVTPPAINAATPDMQGTPVGGGAMWDNTPPPQQPLVGIGQQPLQTGISQQSLPPIPSGAYITPKMVEEAQARSTTKRGQDMTARTAEERLQQERGLRTQGLGETHRHNKAQEAHAATMANIADKRLKIYARTAGSAFHNLSKDQQMYQAHQNGFVKDSEYKAWLTNAGKASGGDSVTTVTDANGNVVKTTTKSKGAAHAIRPSGQAVDVGGGAVVHI